MDKKGIVSVKGKKDEETNEWKIESIEVSLKNKDGSVN